MNERERSQRRSVARNAAVHAKSREGRKYNLRGLQEACSLRDLISERVVAQKLDCAAFGPGGWLLRSGETANCSWTLYQPQRMRLGTAFLEHVLAGAALWLRKPTLRPGLLGLAAQAAEARGGPACWVWLRKPQKNVRTQAGSQNHEQMPQTRGPADESLLMLPQSEQVNTPSAALG